MITEKCKEEFSDTIPRAAFRYELGIWPEKCTKNLKCGAISHKRANIEYCYNTKNKHYARIDGEYIAEGDPYNTWDNDETKETFLERARVELDEKITDFLYNVDGCKIYDTHSHEDATHLHIKCLPRKEGPFRNLWLRMVKLSDEEDALVRLEHP